MSRNIHLALQGGGAKIYGLVAALQAVEELEDAGQIEVKSLAGTSAGAMVAVLYAAGVRAREIRRALAEAPLHEMLGRPVRRGSRKPTWWLSAWQHRNEISKLLKLQPLADPKIVYELVRKLLADQLGKPNPRLEDLPRPVAVVASDLRSRGKVVYASSGPRSDVEAARAVVDSTAIPFYFRVPNGNPRDDLFIDGGVCSNLPADELEPEEGDAIVAISFRAGRRETPITALQFAGALIETAIESNVARSKAGDVLVCELEPYGIGTFDFGRAQEELRSESSAAYNDALRTTRSFLEKEVLGGGTVVPNTRWDLEHPQTLKQNLAIYRSHHHHRKIAYALRRVHIVLRSLAQRPAADLIRQVARFAPETEDLHCLMNMMGVSAGQKPSDFTIQVFDPQGASVPGNRMAHQPALETTLGETRYGMLTYYLPPLPIPDPGCHYRIETAFEMVDAFPNLHEPHRDPELPPGVERVSSGSPREGVTGEVQILLQIPSERTLVAVDPAAGIVPLEPMNDAEAADLAVALPGYTAHGWRARNVPQNSADRKGTSLLFRLG